MEFQRLGLEEEDDEDDAAIQYMIEQSLLESNKQREPHRDSTAPDGRSSGLDSADSSLIFTAIRQGNEKLLKDLCVKHKDKFLQTDSRGWIPLHEAAAQSNHTLLELTVKASGRDSLECPTLRGQTPLFLAVECGLIENTSFLLKHGSCPDSQDHDQDSPLLVAIRSDRADLVKLLLLRGSRVNQQGCHGRCPLHEASRLGRASLVTLLLEAGAQPDPRSHYGLTPLALAAQAGHLEVVQTLLMRGADVLSQAQDEASILYEASASGHPSVIRLLLEYGADANVAKRSGHMPIHRVAHRGHLQALKLLIPVTSVGDVNDSGMSPLHSAAAGGHPHCIKALLDAGYDPNYMLHPWVRRSYDDERKSALFFAVSNNDVPSVTLLLEAGAMANQDPVKCLQVVLRMLCNYGYDVARCFDCPYGNSSHIPGDYEGWSDSVIKDTMVTSRLCHQHRRGAWSLHLGPHLCLGGFLMKRCVCVSAVLRGDHRVLAQAPLRPCGPHPAGLRGSRDLLLQAEGGCDGAAAVARHLQAARKRPLSEAPLPAQDPSLSRSPPSPFPHLHELPAAAGAAEGLHPVPGVGPVRPAEHAGLTRDRASFSISVRISAETQHHTLKSRFHFLNLFSTSFTHFTVRAKRNGISKMSFIVF
ncbi:ankyrin repeat and SOCS box protein 14 isoform X2 [Trachinotus anak]|uniref:ankyrin repeat and SOCS box protein 14 isoform X2 n=1 Tax=Trachinotus anak TaxID=443729 RepID=UPI0039F1B2BC